MTSDEFKKELESLGISRKEFAQLAGFNVISITNTLSKGIISNQLEASLKLVKRIKELESQIAGLKALLKD
ncbi:MAG: hypothetical protein SPH77_02690 [Campylobacter sp.]|uniref:hypothetical protein n=1 Tax=Campylobacter sp. TaxID=205 RepID=UPI002A55E6B2|nr:hypothetical protein [Campylobacter sp.]MDD7091667.1 hypothetical protein [Campylobacteraceae bacterium]MCI7500645.1 hypothetical protein [Campylobacter sp.]MDY3246779.1 hypothetical protein [Campylobacter sp.]MDY3664368.1 hypothetical protein [Campylobacter sp.]MDY4012952.1 hypothetical protein [Campylobacter sp.]